MSKMVLDLGQLITIPIGTGSDVHIWDHLLVKLLGDWYSSLGLQDCYMKQTSGRISNLHEDYDWKRKSCHGLCQYGNTSR